MNLNDLMNQFLGSQQQAQPGGQQAAQQGGAQGGLGGMLQGGLGQGLPGSVQGAMGKFPGGAMGGLAAGGVLGLLLGNKKMRKKVGKVAGGAVGLGGAAVLGALAYNAYQNWQSGKQAPVSAPVNPPAPQTPPQLLSAPTAESFNPAAQPDVSGEPFQLLLIKAMIGAANADGHIDNDEQAAIFDAVGKLDLAADEKGVIFDTLRNPPSVEEIAGYANGLEQASEVYLASRLAIDPDHPGEQAYLERLATLLALPPEFVAHLESQIEASPAPAV